MIKFKVDGDCVRVTNRRQSDSEDRSKPSRVEPSHGRHPIPQAVQFFKPKAGNVNLSLGGSRGPFSFAKENGPLVRVPLRGAGTTEQRFAL